MVNKFPSSANNFTLYDGVDAETGNLREDEGTIKRRLLRALKQNRDQNQESNAVSLRASMRWRFVIKVIPLLFLDTCPFFIRSFQCFQELWGNDYNSCSFLSKTLSLSLSVTMFFDSTCRRRRRRVIESADLFWI